MRVGSAFGASTSTTFGSNGVGEVITANTLIFPFFPTTLFSIFVKINCVGCSL